MRGAVEAPLPSLSLVPDFPIAIPAAWRGATVAGRALGTTGDDCPSAGTGLARRGLAA